MSNLEEADFDKAINLNLKSVYFTVQKALPYMNDGGSIILISGQMLHIGHMRILLCTALQRQPVIYLA